MSSGAASVIIPTFNGRRWLPGVLASLSSQTRPAAEVIVVDNGSVDDSLTWLAGAHPDVRVLALGVNTGFAHACNRGIEATAGDLVALVNPDIVLAPDWLERMTARLLADAGLAAVACKMVDLDDPRTLYGAGDVLRRDGACIQRGRRHRDDGRFDTPGEVFGACAGAAVYRRAAVVSVGGLDERFVTYLEDVDLAVALRADGWRCAYEPAVARHAGGGSSPAPDAHLPWVTRNTLLLVAKWFPARWLPLVAYRQAALLGIATRERRLGAHLRALGAGLALVPGAVRHRRSRAVAIDVLVPVQPIRGVHALGHHSQVRASWAGHRRVP